jgi:nucleoid-associated protein YgaU
MGLIAFVKEAGERLFGGGAQAEAEASIALVKMVTELGIPVEDLRVDVDGDTATVRGVTPTQEDREKVVLVVGNTKGIAKVDDQLRVSGREPEAVYYTVVPGDTLSKIAKAHYGDAMKYPVIFEANRPMLSDPDKIYPGQVLRIPAL